MFVIMGDTAKGENSPLIVFVLDKNNDILVVQNSTAAVGFRIFVSLKK